MRLVFAARSPSVRAKQKGAYKDGLLEGAGGKVIQRGAYCYDEEGTYRAGLLEGAGTFIEAKSDDYSYDYEARGEWLGGQLEGLASVKTPHFSGLIGDWQGGRLLPLEQGTQFLREPAPGPIRGAQRYAGRVIALTHGRPGP